MPSRLGDMPDTFGAVAVDVSRPGIEVIGIERRAVISPLGYPCRSGDNAPGTGCLGAGRCCEGRPGEGTEQGACRFSGLILVESVKRLAVSVRQQLLLSAGDDRGGRRGLGLCSRQRDQGEAKRDYQAFRGSRHFWSFLPLLCA